MKERTSNAQQTVAAVMSCHDSNEEDRKLFFNNRN